MNIDLQRLLSGTNSSSGDRLGALRFLGTGDGASLQAARLQVDVDGATGASDMPGRFVLSTTSDGAATPTERMRITSAGHLGVGIVPSTRLHVYDANQGDIVVGTFASAASGTGTSTSRIQLIKGSGATTYGAEISGYLTQNVGAGLTINTVDAGVSTERMRITSSGSVGIGTSSGAVGIGSTRFMIAGTSYSTTTSQFNSYSADSNPPSVTFHKSRGTSIGTEAVLVSGDVLGVLQFRGSDGTTSIAAAQIDARVDGAPGANDMPGRLVFWTTADGGTTLTERMRIHSTGVVSIGTASGHASSRLFVIGESSFGDGGAGNGGAVTVSVADNWNFGQLRLRRSISNTANFKVVSFLLGADDLANLTLNANWNINLATASTPSASTVSDSSTDMRVYGPGDFAFLQEGNVGIGTSSPSAKLHVSGTATITGTITTGLSAGNVVANSSGALSTVAIEDDQPILAAQVFG